jgi:large subunit ribosomal protein L9
MKIVLLSDIEKLGQVGELVYVKNGYARNFLIPSGMAVKADPKNIMQVEAQRQRAEAKALREVKTHKSMAARLAKAELVAKVQVGEEDRMFGAVTSSDIAEMLAKLEIEIDRRIIDLKEPIKALGIYTVPVKLHADVTAFVKVKVVPEGD